MPTAIGTPVTGQGSSSTPTLSVTVPSGCELMTVRVLIRGSEATPSATQGGNAMTVSTDGTTAADQQHSSTLHTTVFQYANPAPGTVNVVVTLSAARNYVMRVDFYDDFNAAAGPAGNGVLGVVKGGSSSVNPTALGTFASASGALELSAIGARNTAVSLSTTDATEQFELTQSTLIGAGAARTGTGATGQINWTLNTADNWALVNVSYAHAAGGTSKPIAALIAAVSSVTAATRRRRRVAPLVGASSTVTAAVRRRRRIAPLVGASSGVAVTPRRRRPIAPTITGASTVTISARRQGKAITAAVAAASSVVAVPRRRRRLAVGVTVTSTVSAAVRRRRRVTLSISASSSVSATIAGVVPSVPELRPVPDRPPVESRRPLLAIRLRGPGREWSVLGAEDARGIVAEGFTASADRSGPVSCAFNLRRDPTLPQPDLTAFSELDAEVGAQLVWGGRVWELPGSRGAERSLSVSARGWQSHLEDDVLSRFWVHSRLTDWRDMRSYPGQNLAAAPASPSVASVGGSPSFGWPANTQCTNATGVGVMIDLGPGRTAKRVVVNWNIIGGNGAFTLYGRAHDTENSFAVGTVSDAFAIPMETATAFQAGTFATARRYVSIFLYRDDGLSGLTGADHFVQLLAIRVFAATDLESGNHSALRASRVVSDVLSSGAVPLLSPRTDRIVTSGLIDAGTRGIPHFDSGDGYQSPRQLIDAANAYQGWNAGVDARKQLFFEPRPAEPVCEVGEWSGAEFSDQSTASAETLYNRVVVQGSDASGGPVTVIRTASVPALDLLGVTRTMVLAVSAVLTTGSAETIGDAWLAEKARSQFKGSLKVAGMGSVRDLQTGRPMHPSELLALPGQMIRLSHLVDPDTGGEGRDAIISAVQYEHDGESASISLDNENGRLDALLARVGALQAVAT